MKHLIICSFLLVAVLSSTAFAGTAQVYYPKALNSQERPDKAARELHALLERMADPDRISPITQKDLKLFNDNVALLKTTDFAKEIFDVERHVIHLSLENENRQYQSFRPIVDNLNLIWQHHFEQYLAQNTKENAAQIYFADVKNFEDLLPKMQKIRKEYQAVVLLLDNFEKCSAPKPNLAKKEEELKLQFVDLMNDIYQQYLRQVAALMQEEGIPAKFNPPQDGKSGSVKLTLERTENQINIDPQKIVSPALAPLKFLIEQYLELPQEAEGKINQLNIAIGNVRGVRGKDEYWKIRVLAQEAISNGMYCSENNTLYLDDSRFFFDPIFLINSTIVHELTHVHFEQTPDRVINTYPYSSNKFITRFIYEDGFTTDEIYARVNSINYLLEYLQNSFPADSDIATRDILITEIALKLMESDSFILTTKQLLNDLIDRGLATTYAKEHSDKIEYIFTVNPKVTNGNRLSALILTANRSDNTAITNSPAKKVTTPPSVKRFIYTTYQELRDLEQEIRSAYQILMKEYRFKVDDFAKNQDFFPLRLNDYYFFKAR